MLKRIIRALSRKIANGYARISVKYLPNPSNNNRSNIERLREKYSSMPVADSSSGTESEKKWNINLNLLRSYVLTRDLSGFLRWDVIRRTMFVDNAYYINEEYKYLQKQASYKEYWEKAIQENETGNPIRYWRNLKTSGNVVHHAYHLANYENTTNNKLCQHDLIIEFGGGYGSLCRVVHKLGFSGRYVIFDLPNFSALQEYYLRSVGLCTYRLDELNAQENGIFLSSELAEIPNLVKQIPSFENVMFIATWSMSEAPVYIRDQLIDLVKNSKSVLIGYQDAFGEVNNKDYFNNLKNIDPEKLYIEKSIHHLPGNKYLFGTAK